MTEQAWRKTERIPSNRTIFAGDVLLCYGGEEQSWKRTVCVQGASLPGWWTVEERHQVWISCACCVASCFWWWMLLLRARWRIWKLTYLALFLYLASKQSTRCIVLWYCLQRVIISCYYRQPFLQVVKICIFIYRFNFFSRLKRD